MYYMHTDFLFVSLTICLRISHLSNTHTRARTHAHANQPCAFLPAVQLDTETFGLAADYDPFSQISQISQIQ